MLNFLVFFFLPYEQDKVLETSTVSQPPQEDDESNE
jgi:hypothetical protein